MMESSKLTSSTAQASESCVDPASVLPFKLPVRPSGGVKLSIRKCTAFVHDLLFKVKKDGATFWIGACVPQATSDFTRAYIFFHPDTMGDSDSTYTGFTGRWPGVRRYVRIQGVQLAEKQNMVLLVPFMTSKSGFDATANMFESRGLDTLNSIMDACQTAIGKTPKGSKLASVGVASFSSGINHLARFSAKIGGGIIKEQIDLDSAFMTKAKHSVVQRIGSARNIQVTQMSPSDPRVTHSDTSSITSQVAFCSLKWSWPAKVYWHWQFTNG